MSQNGMGLTEKNGDGKSFPDQQNDSTSVKEELQSVAPEVEVTNEEVKVKEESQDQSPLALWATP